MPQSIPDPFLIPEIVENIVAKLDDKMAMSSRLVSRLWNEEVSTALRKRILEKKYRSHGVVIFYDKFDERPNIPIPSFFNQSEMLDVLLYGMQIYFRDWSALFPDNSVQMKNHFDTQDDENMLSKYGSYARNASISYDLGQGNLLRLLTDFCPNLESLELRNPVLLENIVFEFSDKISLNLEHFTFHLARNSDYIRMIRNVPAFKGVLRACPKLKYLEVDSPSLFMYLMEIKDVPDITTNLVELILAGEILNNVHYLNRIQFSSKLEKVQLEIFGGQSQLSVEMVQKLKCFLRKVGHTLRCFEIQFNDFTGDEIINLNVSNMDVFPKMPVLETLVCFFDFESLQFLENLPNLLQLHLTGITDTERLFVHPCPSNKINSLTLSQPDTWMEYYAGLSFHRISDSDMVKNRSQAFPNLLEYFIELSPPKILSKRGLEKWFENVCDEISQMKYLQNLRISLQSLHEYSWEWYTELDLDSGFELLKNTPNLETLVLGHRFEALDQVFPRKPLLKLIDAPKLLILKLIGLLVDSTDNSNATDIAEVADFFESFSKSAITLIPKMDWDMFLDAEWMDPAMHLSENQYQ